MNTPLSNPKGLLSKIKRRLKHSGVKPSTKSEPLKPGDKVYISTMMKAYSGVVLQKDDSSDGTHILNGRHYLVEIPTTGEVLPVHHSMLTKRLPQRRPQTVSQHGGRNER